METSYYLEKAPIPKAIANLSIPMMVGMLVGAIYNIINAFFIGKLNNPDMLGAIAITLPIFTIIMAIGNLFGAGAGTYISRLLGEKNYTKAKNASSFAVYAGIFVGLVLILIALPFIKYIVEILGANPAIYGYTKNYVVVLLIGCPFMILNFLLEQLVRSEGAAKISMIGIIVSSVVNVILDPILILYMHLDVRGAAIATVLSNAISALYYGYYIVKNSKYLSVKLSDFKIDKDILVNTLKIGIPEFIFVIFLGISSLILNNAFAVYGDNVLAGYGIESRICQVPEFIVMGIAQGIVPLIAFNYTAKNISRLNKAMRFSAMLIIGIVVVISGTIYLLNNNVIALFTNDIDVINIGTYMLRVLLISTFFSGLTTLMVGSFQAIGREKEAMVVSISQGFLFIPILFIFKYLYRLHGVIWVLPVAEILNFILTGILFISMKRKVLRFDTV
ncbi:MATE family efflux transporter [Clostridium mediterraneense]|uniref:MATE family efflux transporter n=1 Tax=Clostridium mediterraneense TaxID=1805472 RepID=UPI000832E8D5|nr:MATE family efflux transporter [Clostridium mediterraneense]